MAVPTKKQNNPQTYPSLLEEPRAGCLSVCRTDKKRHATPNSWRTESGVECIHQKKNVPAAAQTISWPAAMRIGLLVGHLSDQLPPRLHAVIWTRSSLGSNV